MEDIRWIEECSTEGVTTGTKIPVRTVHETMNMNRKMMMTRREQVTSQKVNQSPLSAEGAVE